MNPQPHRWDAELAGLVDDDRASRGLPPLGDIPIVDRRQTPADGRVDRVGPAPTTIGTTEEERRQAAAQVRTEPTPADSRGPAVPATSQPSTAPRVAQQPTQRVSSTGRLIAVWAMVAITLLNVGVWLASLWVPPMLHVAVGPVRQLLGTVWLAAATATAAVWLTTRRH